MISLIYCSQKGQMNLFKIHKTKYYCMIGSTVRTYQVMVLQLGGFSRDLSNTLRVW